jgi:metal-responsive CopG/Arc/MetJ family transcriptional regulator
MERHLEQEKRGPGRPLYPGRKQRINVTLSPDTLQELEDKVPLKQRSALIEKLIRRELGLEER